jgi:hypothetical protein
VAIGQFGGDSFRVSLEAGGERGIIQCPLQNGMSLKVAFGGDVVSRFEEIRVVFEYCANLIKSPHIELALFASEFGIMLECAASGMGHFGDEMAFHDNLSKKGFL